MKNSIEIAISVLLSGFPVTIKDRTYKLFLPGEEVNLPSSVGETTDYWLGIQCKTDKGEEKYIGADISFSSMISILSNIPEDEIILMAMNKTLTELHHKGRI